MHTKQLIITAIYKDMLKIYEKGTYHPELYEDHTIKVINKRNNTIPLDIHFMLSQITHMMKIKWTTASVVTWKELHVGDPDLIDKIIIMTAPFGVEDIVKNRLQVLRKEEINPTT